jgi:hypothetical protein
LWGQGEKAGRREKIAVKEAREGMGWGKVRGTEGRRVGPVAAPRVGAGPHPKGQMTQRAGGMMARERSREGTSPRVL